MPAPASQQLAPQQLDEVMLAMDVVDTIRHSELIVERELAQGDRDEALRNRLREIYRTQGLEVSDAAIDQGIKALRESRFAYVPPPPGMARTLALLWIARTRILTRTAAIVVSAGLLVGFWHYGITVPREQAAAAARIELAETLPKDLRLAASSARIESRDPAATQEIDRLEREGSRAIAAADPAAARAAVSAIDALRTRLLATYQVEIVSRPGATSGVWRYAEGGNSGARNYYVIVEAIAPDGTTLSLPVRSEEDGTTREVTAWGLRVPESFYEAVKADKLDNGIIENRQVGAKLRGELDPRYSVQGAGGAITSWDE